VLETKPAVGGQVDALEIVKPSASDRPCDDDEEDVENLYQLYNALALDICDLKPRTFRRAATTSSSEDELASEAPPFWMETNTVLTAMTEALTA
jgi:hypothetical protein